MSTLGWPATVWVVRHRESMGNVAARVGARGILARELLDEAPRVLAELRA